MQRADTEQKRPWRFELHSATRSEVGVTQIHEKKKEGIFRCRMDITVIWRGIYLSVNTTIHRKFKYTFRRISRLSDDHDNN